MSSNRKPPPYQSTLQSKWLTRQRDLKYERYQQRHNAKVLESRRQRELKLQNDRFDLYFRMPRIFNRQRRNDHKNFRSLYEIDEEAMDYMDANESLFSSKVPLNESI